MSETATALDGVKVLVVEDETIVAMLLEQMLEELSCEVVGVAGQVSAAARCFPNPSAWISCAKS
jgi:CheY-like chemotaxis protein